MGNDLDEHFGLQSEFMTLSLNNVADGDGQWYWSDEQQDCKENLSKCPLIK